MAATETFQSFIVALPAETRSVLYQSTWTCQALFRALGPLAQQYVLRLLYVNTPVEQGAPNRCNWHCLEAAPVAWPM
jgi:hypothetical protein